MDEGSGGQRAGRAVSKDELFELIVESAVDYAMFTIDADRVATSWNVGAERLFGYAEAEIVGRSADLVFTPEDRAAGVPQAEVRQALTGGRAADERWHMRKDGSRFWAAGLLMPLKAGGGGFVKITRDRTEQHRDEERLRESEARFRLLATSIPQLVFRSRPDGWRTWGSPQWIEFSGLSLDESLKLGWLDAVHPDDREPTMAAWRIAGIAGEYYAEQRIRRAADGEYRWHQTRAKPVRTEGGGDGGAGGEWVGTMTDIHDLKGLQERQRVLMAELQHRTRNLLAVVQSIAQRTLRGSASLEAFGEEFESRLRALSRVQGLLARVDQETIGLRAIVEAELEAHGDGAAEPGRRVRVDGPPVALPAGAAQTLALALHELATNSVKYGALGDAPASRLAVTWGLEGDGHRVALEWRESGVPIAQGGPPRRRGYGSELIERALPYQLGAETSLEFGPDGVRCAIAVPLEEGRAGADGGG